LGGAISTRNRSQAELSAKKQERGEILFQYKGVLRGNQNRKQTDELLLGGLGSKRELKEGEEKGTTGGVCLGGKKRQEGASGSQI